MHNQWALRITTLCLGVVSLGLATAVSAQVSQPDIDAIAPRQEQILQQQQQQFDDVQRQQHTITPPTSLPALTADSALDFGECVDINNIDIRGGTLIAGNTVGTAFCISHSRMFHHCRDERPARGDHPILCPKRLCDESGLFIPRRHARGHFGYVYY